jgi:hypothetical protein
MRLTIQCEPFGKPATAAGPKARAVFMAAPVYGTANLNNPISFIAAVRKSRDLHARKARRTGSRRISRVGRATRNTNDLQMTSKEGQTHADLFRYQFLDSGGDGILNMREERNNTHGSKRC